METSFYTQKKYLVIIQNLVKRFDGRFKNNPAAFSLSQFKVFVIVSFDDGSKGNKFMTMITIVEQSYF